MNGSGRALSHPDCLSVLYTGAKERGYLANLADAVGLGSLAQLRNTSDLTHTAGIAYSSALRHIRAALADPVEAASDQMLVAITLLVLYEVSCLIPKSDTVIM
jgi:hypothetical protein